MCGQRWRRPRTPGRCSDCRPAKHRQSAEAALNLSSSAGPKSSCELHPITPAQFPSDFEGCRPLHILAAEGSNKSALLTWDGFNGRLKRTPEGMIRRPTPAKVEVGASVFCSFKGGQAFHDMGPIARRAHDWTIEERQFAVPDLVAEKRSLSGAHLRRTLAGAEQAGTIQKLQPLSGTGR